MKHQKLTEATKQNIREAFTNLAGCGVPEDILIKMLADHCVGILELPKEVLKEFYIEETNES
jgi:hypothetical protein